MTTVDKDAEMIVLDKVLRSLVANGFEWRGGDTFPKETVSIYMNDKLDEFVMVRFNRADMDGRQQPPLIHRGAMEELDRPMNDMESLRFVTIPEFLGVPVVPKQEPQPAPAALAAKTKNAFKPPVP